MAGTKNNTELDRFARLAREAGMSYGKFQMMETVQRIKEAEKKRGKKHGK